MSAIRSNQQAEWVLDLIHQGLLPLSRRTLLTARLVCKHWQQSLSRDITHISLPYDAWTTLSKTSISARLAGSNHHAADQTGWRTAATAAAAALEAVREEVGLDEAGDTEVTPRSKRTQGNSSRGSKAGNARAAAAAGALPHSDIAQQQPDPADIPQEPQQQAAGADEAMQHAHALNKPKAAAGAHNIPAPGLAATILPLQPPQQEQRAHPLHLLPFSLPECTLVTLSNRRSVWYNPQAPCGPAAIAQAVALLGKLLKLDSLCVQGYMPAADWQPLLSALAGSCQQQQQEQQDQQREPAEQQQPGSVLREQQDAPQAAAEAVVVDHPAQDQPQQLQPMQQPKQQIKQQLSLCTRLVTLDLQSLELPPPLLLEAALVGLQGLRSLTVHASMESVLEGAHLEALATGSQLTSLVLKVYQAGHSRCPLDPLMALTNLHHLEVSYGGIFNDQRPVLSEASATSRLVHLTCLASSGLAQPLLPQPNITTLRSLRVSGLTKRLAESNVQLISSCNSTALRDLRLEGGRRGIAAVAADQLDHLGFMTQLTSLSLALSKGSLPAGKSAQQLQKLSGLTALKTLWLGSGDHRLGLSTEQLQELGQQWPALDSLRLSGFSPLQGFAGLGAFTGLTALSMKPGVGTGKVLLELDVALQQLSLLRRLHLDFRSALQLEHVEAITAACATRLQHLSLNMWAPGIGSKALVAIGQLSVLTSLQLMNMRAAVLSGPPGIVALREMPSLELLCVQAADEVITDQQPLSLGGYLSEALTGHVGPLREVRMWLGSGVEARQAEAGVAAVVDAQLPDCRCRILKEPEKAIL